ncbi:MAG: EAL and HDOD domain-containing protein [Marinomonas sp.]|jgi:EAL and modified HD-GYP domain-containing signal transduction protein|uniref:EAL and HDOD domain-containing protein n=1 Tax=unclassified Marinomonas TaxID=196814 RepID=UPI0005FA331A|nr:MULTISPECIES: HDOD domain-containing protein [unclassified Marinomonas]KJZ12841.1 diguanylate phosphodiesterase [Marinomonas sp. S3726]KZM42933.1 diguanylate phosphodiesterase [Marinomonas sp. SBI22]KZM44503.1 diguanylate phosphodiesterase [Marinomonas sp. SBI8L]
MENRFDIYTLVTLARQPILDAKQSIYGYELLYRGSGTATDAEIFDDVSATAQVVSTALLEIGMSNLVGSGKAFVNFPRTYLLNPSGVPLDREQVVIEVLDNSNFDAVLLASLRKWKNSGYDIALDDLRFEAKLTPFIELASFVKLDLQALGREAFITELEAFRNFDIKVIACKVETWDEFNFCRMLDVDFFQGYFFEKPQTIERKAVKVNSMTLLQLMAELLKSNELSVDELDRIVSQDVGLVHKLLKYLNSPVTGLIASVDSVKLAIVLVGAEQLKALTSLLLMSEMVGDRHALLQQVLIRAKHAELFAVKMGYANQDKYFLAGMLSMIDVCMGMDLPDVLASLPLPGELASAIVNRSGKIGLTLTQIEQYSKGHQVTGTVPQETLKETYLEAISWVDDFLSTI